jgi:hypothetical protein
LQFTVRKSIKCPYRRVKEFQKGYQPRSNLVKDKNSDLLANSDNIVNWWKRYFSQVLNVHDVCDVGQIEIHTAEPLVPDSSRLEFEIAIARLK